MNIVKLDLPMSQKLPYNCDMSKGVKYTQIIVSKVKSSIYGHGRGWCFTPNDFLEIGPDTAVRQALSRLQKSGLIRRLSWGLYDYPRNHKTLGVLPPDIEQAAIAVARKDNLKLLPSGAYAANLLGLSDQVPAKVVYFTQGPPKKIRAGKREIIFKSTTSKNMATAGNIAGLVIQALKYLGKTHVDKGTITRLKRKLSKSDLNILSKHVRHAPAWIQKIIHNLTGATTHG